MLRGTDRIPNPEEPIPAVAWPTVGLLASGIGLWALSAAGYLSGSLPVWLSAPLGGLAAYLCFTVSHDAGHHSVARSDRLNTLVGRIATPLFAPHAAFPVWRFIHMQHHRFTNHSDGRDPDAYTMAGPSWQRPLRWLTVDIYYLLFYAPRLRSRPRAEQLEEFAQLAAVAALVLAAALSGHLIDLLLVYFLPCRIAVLILAWAFDYLPHHGLHHTPEQDKLKGTRNRVGAERLLAPVLLYQNYHLVHHLHPLVPFYRYIAVWRRNERVYLEGEPALSTVRGRPLSADEYRRLRGLSEAHEPAAAPR